MMYGEKYFIAALTRKLLRHKEANSLAVYVLKKPQNCNHAEYTGCYAPVLALQNHLQQFKGYHQTEE